MDKSCGISSLDPSSSFYFLPPSITTRSNRVEIFFHTDASQTQPGWSLSWSAVTPGMKVLLLNSVEIFHPFFTNKLLKNILSKNTLQKIHLEMYLWKRRFGNSRFHTRTQSVPLLIARKDLRIFKDCKEFPLKGTTPIFSSCPISMQENLQTRKLVFIPVNAPLNAHSRASDFPIPPLF